MRNEKSRGTTTEIADRLETRLAVPRAERAFVEFDYPQPTGKRRRLSLLDLSTGGLCFALPFYGLSGIELSTHLLDVIVRIGGCEIEGELLVSHVTRESDERILCGGRFYPATESDQLQMTKAIASLESIHES
ncbi:MAG: hypothetical protein E2P01_06990 [Acidobacteria bacterium]|nr:MAG: hypothetical protein E2P01_06990 [Acidobacteriota bacterium]